MTEQKPSYMQQLDEWTQGTIIDRIHNAFEDYADAVHERDLPEKEANQVFEKAHAEVKKAVRERVLESYRNGQKAGPPKVWRSKNKQQK